MAKVGRNGRAAKCKECKRVQNNAGDAAFRRRLSRYGLSEAAFFALYEIQQGRCGCCSDPLPSGRHTHIDHDHLTGLVRALLCNNCNCLLGHAKDDPARTRAATAYLERHHGAREAAGFDVAAAVHGAPAAVD